MRRYTAALVVSAAVVGVAPFAAAIRDAIEAALAEGYLRWMGIGFALAVAAIVAWVVARIRDDRALRWGLLVVALLLLVGQLAGWSRDSAAVNAVERIHFLYYGWLGVLWPRAFRRRRGDLSALASAMLAILVVALADEGVQWWVAARTGEIYDVVLNVYAGAIGVLIGLAVDGRRSLRWRFEPGAARDITLQAAAALIVAAAFIHLAHLGYRIEDPEIGRFRSYFSREELASASRDRAARWAERPLGPPGIFAALEREDWFRTEAGMRVQHRNAALERGDVYQAWKENLILERYYQPFLDQLGRDGHPFRLPAEARRSLDEARPRRDPYLYDSPVGRVPHRIWLWPSKLLLWIVASTLAIAVLVAPAALGARHEPSSAPKT